jgi:hypothetical protein
MGAGSWYWYCGRSETNDVQSVEKGGRTRRKSFDSGVRDKSLDYPLDSNPAVAAQFEPKPVQSKAEERGEKGGEEERRRGGEEERRRGRKGRRGSLR